jgi:hypothetical protein
MNPAKQMGLIKAGCCLKTSQGGLVFKRGICTRLIKLS